MISEYPVQNWVSLLVYYIQTRRSLSSLCSNFKCLTVIDWKPAYVWFLMFDIKPSLNAIGPSGIKHKTQSFWQEQSTAQALLELQIGTVVYKVIHTHNYEITCPSVRKTGSQEIVCLEWHRFVSVRFEIALTSPEPISQCWHVWFIGWSCKI